MRLLLRTLLIDLGCVVSEAANGQDAVRIVSESLESDINPNPIELILCDIRMPPGMDGIETTQLIKMIPGASNLPVIGMTADDVTNAALTEAVEAGMVSLVCKPIGKTELVTFLSEYTTTTGEASSSKLSSTACDDDSIHHHVSEQGSWDVQGALETCGGDPSVLAHLLGDLVMDLSSRHDELSSSVRSNDCSRVGEIAHNIKGMASICNFRHLAQAANECQQSASKCEYVEVRSKCQIVLDEITKAISVAKSFDSKEWL
jgi:CheY-like chemotaxis protein